MGKCKYSFAAAVTEAVARRESPAPKQKEILVPIDFTETSVTALRCARALAAGDKAPDWAQSFQHRPLRGRLSGRMDDPSVHVVKPPGMETKPGCRIRSILVPTDFSACSVEAVAQGAALGRLYDATLTILHVIDINPPSARTHLGAAEDLMKQLWATGIAELRGLTESSALKQTKTQPAIGEGLPAEVIIENSSGFDLLVIGEQRSKSAWHLFSRHTARRVIEGAACPVLVVH